MNETKTSPMFLRSIFIGLTSLFASLVVQRTYRRFVGKPLCSFVEKNQKSCQLGQNGITLVEILVAISVASLVMLPIILLFGVTEKVTYKSINEVVASHLALQKIEELKSRPFEKLREIIQAQSSDPIDGPFAEVKLPREFNDQWNSPGVEYSRQASLAFYPYPNPDVTAVDYELQKRRIRIRVAVDFSEMVLGKKRIKTFDISTIVTDETLGSGLNTSFPNPVSSAGGNK